MRTLTFAAIAAALSATDAIGQRGGDGGRGRWREPAEITERVGLFFHDVDGPAADGDRVADLATVELVRAAISARQLSVLYLVDGTGDEQTRQSFEWQLGRDRELGIELRCFHCGRIELSKNPALAARYDKKAPLFVVFDEDGKATEVPMAGYRAKSSALKKALEKSAGGAMKPALPTFAKQYGKIMRDLEAVLRKRAEVGADLARAGNDKAGRKKAEKELDRLAADERKLQESERKLLDRVRLPERGSGARRIGAQRGGRGRGGR